jgi:hypothetical protein
MHKLEPRNPTLPARVYAEWAEYDPGMPVPLRIVGNPSIEPTRRSIDMLKQTPLVMKYRYYIYMLIEAGLFIFGWASLLTTVFNVNDYRSFRIVISLLALAKAYERLEYRYPVTRDKDWWEKLYPPVKKGSELT